MSDPHHQEIIIIKRGNEEEEGHHGGAWKIAFADFMTAMMALFLVLWLINAANEETKRAVASYFNPIKLVDRNRSVKGVEEQKGGPAETDETGGTPNPDTVVSDDALTTKSLGTKDASDVEKQLTGKNEEFFADPMAALDKIEASILEKQGISNKIETEGKDGKPGQFTDPFNSETREEESAAKSAEVKDQPHAEEPKPSAREAYDSATEIPQTPSDPEQPGKAEKAQLAEAAAELEAAVRQDIAEKLGTEAASNNSIEVKATENGILIQITDTAKTAMFDIGAAIPKGETVITLNAVAKALVGRPGPVHVHGHTDARKYDGPGNGNWRLSLDRAQSVYFVLLRAGLAEDRFAEVSGFADRKLVVTGDPLADQNRRIEIFLEQS